MFIIYLVYLSVKAVIPQSPRSHSNSQFSSVEFQLTPLSAEKVTFSFPNNSDLKLIFITESEQNIKEHAGMAFEIRLQVPVKSLKIQHSSDGQGLSKDWENKY